GGGGDMLRASGTCGVPGYCAPTDAPTTDVYTLSLHDALPIYTLDKGHMYDAASTILAQKLSQVTGVGQVVVGGSALPSVRMELKDRKSTRLNSSHDQISYAVFCLKKKKNRRRS